MKVINIRQAAARSLESRPIRLLKYIWAWQPLTWRGVMALVLATIALRAFAIADFDLVADVLGVAVLALLLVSLLSVLVLRIRIGRTLQVEAHFDPTNVYSKNEIAAGLVVTGSSLPPFFLLRLRRRFKHPGVLHSTHIVRNREPEGSRRHLIDSMVFPHRGYWEVQGVDCELQDALGLVSFSWRMPLQSGIEVGVKTLPIQPLPIVAASARAGDQISKSTERAGDLFDLKQYDPSDGIKRILWKVYAKSGQLIVRRPEPAVIPEGEVALYLVAGPTEDYVAGALLGYLEQLEAQQITVLFGTDGFEQTTIGSNQGFVTTDHHIREAVNRCVWSADAGTGRGFSSYLSALDRANRSMTNVIVFGAVENTGIDDLTALAARSSIYLSLALVPKELDVDESLAQLESQIRAKRVQNILSATPSVLRGPTAGMLHFAERISGIKRSRQTGYPKVGQTPNCEVLLVQGTENHS